MGYRTCRLLPNEFGTPRERINLLNQLYRLRSDIVHGSAALTEIQEAVPQGEKILKAILKWHIENRDTTSVETRLRALDEALVLGGTTWAYPPPN